MYFSPHRNDEVSRQLIRSALEESLMRHVSSPEPRHRPSFTEWLPHRTKPTSSSTQGLQCPPSGDHQLAAIHAMTQLETAETEIRPDVTLETTVGVLSDRVGSGKSLTAIGLIAHRPVIQRRQITSLCCGLDTSTMVVRKMLPWLPPSTSSWYPTASSSSSGAVPPRSTARRLVRQHRKGVPPPRSLSVGARRG